MSFCSGGQRDTYSSRDTSSPPIPRDVSKYSSLESFCCDSKSWHTPSLRKNAYSL